MCISIPCMTGTTSWIACLPCRIVSNMPCVLHACMYSMPYMSNMPYIYELYAVYGRHAVYDLCIWAGRRLRLWEGGFLWCTKLSLVQEPSLHDKGGRLSYKEPSLGKNCPWSGHSLIGELYPWARKLSFEHVSRLWAGGCCLSVESVIGELCMQIS